MQTAKSMEQWNRRVGVTFRVFDDIAEGHCLRLNLHEGSGTNNGPDVYFENNVLSSFEDVRFYMNGNELQFYLENIVASTSATAWVRMPNAFSEGDTIRLWVYYDNTSASPASDAAAVSMADTFGYADDTELTDGTGWADVDNPSAGTSITFGASGMELDSSTGRVSVEYTGALPTGGYALRARVKIEDPSAPGPEGLMCIKSDLAASAGPNPTSITSFLSATMRLAEQTNLTTYTTVSDSLSSQDVTSFHTYELRYDSSDDDVTLLRDDEEVRRAVITPPGSGNNIAFDIGNGTDDLGTMTVEYALVVPAVRREPQVASWGTAQSFAEADLYTAPTFAHGATDSLDGAAHPDWFDASYKFRIRHVIAPAQGAGSDWPVQLRILSSGDVAGGDSSAAAIALGGLAKDDFGDVRFTAADGTTALDYWIQEKTDGTSATVWVKVSDDLSTANTLRSIFVYFGNTSATSASNGPNTFSTFVDFTEETDVPSGWMAINGDGSNIEFSSGDPVRFNGDGSRLARTESPGSNQGISVMMRANVSSGSASLLCIALSEESTPCLVSGFVDGADGFSADATVGSNSYATGPRAEGVTGWFNYEFRVFTNGTAELGDIDGVLKTLTTGESFSGTNLLIGADIDVEDSANYVEVEWLAVRPASTTDPRSVYSAPIEVQGGKKPKDFRCCLTQHVGVSYYTLPSFFVRRSAADGTSGLDLATLLQSSSTSGTGRGYEAGFALWNIVVETDAATDSLFAPVGILNIKSGSTLMASFILPAKRFVDSGVAYYLLTSVTEHAPLLVSRNGTYLGGTTAGSQTTWTLTIFGSQTESYADLTAVNARVRPLGAFMDSLSGTKRLFVPVLTGNDPVRVDREGMTGYEIITTDTGSGDVSWVRPIGVTTSSESLNSDYDCPWLTVVGRSGSLD
jgi:uncharacterized protein YbdZ (MbtH family)